MQRFSDPLIEDEWGRESFFQYLQSSRYIWYMCSRKSEKESIFTKSWESKMALWPLSSTNSIDRFIIMISIIIIIIVFIILYHLPHSKRSHLKPYVFVITYTLFIPLLHCYKHFSSKHIDRRSTPSKNWTWYECFNPPHTLLHTFMWSTEITMITCGHLPWKYF